MDLRQIKDKYQIIGNDPGLNRAIEAAVNVASTDPVSYTHLDVYKRQLRYYLIQFFNTGFGSTAGGKNCTQN